MALFLTLAFIDSDSDIRGSGLFYSQIEDAV
jgi:hypothetical protein